MHDHTTKYVVLKKAESALFRVGNARDMASKVNDYGSKTGAIEARMSSLTLLGADGLVGEQAVRVGGASMEASARTAFSVSPVSLRSREVTGGKRRSARAKARPDDLDREQPGENGGQQRNMDQEVSGGGSKAFPE